MRTQASVVYDAHVQVARSPSMAKRIRPLVQLARRGGQPNGVPDTALLVHEIYSSVQGEGSHVGLPCSFIRLTGCHLRCHYCDTAHAFAGGETLDVAGVVARTLALSPRLVLLTGGEPLLQPAALPLMVQLLDAGCKVLLETSGAVSLANIDPRVVCIVDVKTPGSGEQQANLWSNVGLLKKHDEVKFVLKDRADYLWAKDIVSRYQLPARAQVLFGPVWGALAPQELVAWIMADKLDVRLQLQLHKYIWPADARGV